MGLSSFSKLGRLLFSSRENEAPHQSKYRSMSKMVSHLSNIQSWMSWHRMSKNNLVFDQRIHRMNEQSFIFCFDSKSCISLSSDIMRGYTFMLLPISTSMDSWHTRNISSSSIQTIQRDYPLVQHWSNGDIWPTMHEYSRQWQIHPSWVCQVTTWGKSWKSVLIVSKDTK